MARTGVGYDVIDVPAATELGVIVVNIPDIWVREVANHALALLLAWNRKIVVLDRQVHAGVWSAGVPGERTGSLHGETVGIVGLGNIGSAFARRVAALETHGHRLRPLRGRRALQGARGGARRRSRTLAERADYVSVHTLLNAETRHLIGEAFFRRMKPTAILINTSRGPVVDEAALAQALRDKRLAGAALDVWEQEPVAADNPLLKMDNVIATPHAAYFSSPAVAQVPRRCGEEVARVLTGQRPLTWSTPRSMRRAPPAAPADSSARYCLTAPNVSPVTMCRWSEQGDEEHRQGDERGGGRQRPPVDLLVGDHVVDRDGQRARLPAGQDHREQEVVPREHEGQDRGRDHARA